jgi:hypothetical protein
MISEFIPTLSAAKRRDFWWRSHFRDFHDVRFASNRRAAGDASLRSA